MVLPLYYYYYVASFTSSISVSRIITLYGSAADYAEQRMSKDVDAEDEQDPRSLMTI